MLVLKTNRKYIMKIAAFILTYNEEKRIRDTISALKGFDEIMLCDKSSTDSTREIAKELGAKVLQIDYSDADVLLSERKKIKEYLDNEIESEWVFYLSTSDIVHYKLYDELVNVINNGAKEYDVIEIPMHKFSMGATGENTFLGATRYEKNVFRKKIYKVDYNLMIHESEFKDDPAYRLQCKDSNIAVYHLTHPTLDLIMDRHWRYAVKYVKDSALHGRDRERVMRYSFNECIRLVYRYFRRGIYKSKEVGKAQLMMLIMYNCMIYLNAYFDKDMEKQIADEYQRIKDMCIGKN